MQRRTARVLPAARASRDDDAREPRAVRARRPRRQVGTDAAGHRRVGPGSPWATSIASSCDACATSPTGTSPAGIGWTDPARRRPPEVPETSVAQELGTDVRSTRRQACSGPEHRPGRRAALRVHDPRRERAPFGHRARTSNVASAVRAEQGRRRRETSRSPRSTTVQHRVGEPARRPPGRRESRSADDAAPSVPELRVVVGATTARADHQAVPDDARILAARRPSRAPSPPPGTPADTPHPGRSGVDGDDERLHGHRGDRPR